jgi:hypothetical protein
MSDPNMVTEEDKLAGEPFLRQPPLPSPEPQPWWRFISRAKWRFGSGRPDLEIQAFTGVIYAAAEGSSRKIPALRDVAAAVQRLRSRPDLPAALACESLYYDSLPVEYLRAELWALRDRLARVATKDALAAFNGKRIADLEKASDEDVIAEVHSILGYTHKSYYLATIREVAAGRLKFVLFVCTILTFIGLMGLVNWKAEEFGIRQPFSVCLGFALIMITGGIGAMMSVGRRLQGAIKNKVMADDPLFEIAALELGRVGVLLSCLIGAIFAGLVYLMLYGGAGQIIEVKGVSVFPDFSPDVWGAKPGLSAALCFAKPSDMARMLVIAFIAGFAERLVPDAIDRVLSQSAKKAAAGPTTG